MWGKSANTARTEEFAEVAAARRSPRRRSPGEKARSGSPGQNPHPASAPVSIAVVSRPGEKEARSVDCSSPPIPSPWRRRARSKHGGPRGTIQQSPQPPGFARAPFLQAPPCLCLPSHPPRAAPGYLRDPRGVLLLPLIVLPKLALVPKQSCSVEDPTTQPCRPSVKWDLDSSTDYEIPVPSFAAAGSSDFRRDKLERRQEVSAGGGPQVIFMPPRTAYHPVLFSLMNCSEAAVKKVLPKSHLSQVIMRDNLHAQRTYELQEKALEKARKKTSQWYEHMKKKFITDQLRKLGHWRQESMKIQPYLDSLRAYEIQLKLQSFKNK
ncbi:PREDICTED: uncharacterized protein C5orf52 homolog [Chinchilla lanigera]|uniref:uncharacterized protein C5orf52 homolog n=1 Tax=Chinchilla lanigera TaxID=34839 RepID=UPI000695A4A3|nr:PREDICTED: uncharacterized protein C5orf52 homolog [Chinchilla lanigera]